MKSAFRQNFGSILRLLQHGKEGEMDHVLTNCFQQFQHERELPQLQFQLQSLRAKAATLEHIDGEEGFPEYLRLMQVRIWISAMYITCKRD